ncbi:MAG TPA: DNA-directed RNA polymerase subunit omega [Deinococcales bacterium]|nr:DNA-directed RNA polymerase subunit omega [Deinococcales bacterium]
MAQEGYDRLMELTDSRYRLSMIVARRAAQLKLGVAPLLEDDELPGTVNTVTLAMREFELGKPIRWGDDLPDVEALRRTVTPPRQESAPAAAAPATPASG